MLSFRATKSILSLVGLGLAIAAYLLFRPAAPTGELRRHPPRFSSTTTEPAGESKRDARTLPTPSAPSGDRVQAQPIEKLATLRGKVSNEAGEPLFRASIDLSYDVHTFSPISGSDDCQTTLPDGSFVVPKIRPNKILFLTVSFGELAPWMGVVRGLVSGEERKLDTIVLTEAVGLSGGVFDEGGIPVQGAAVTVFTQLGVQVGETETDFFGRFRIATLAEGSYTLECRARGFLKPPDRWILVRGHAAHVEFVLPQRGNRLFEGRVVDRAGIGIEQASVRLLCLGRCADVHRATTDDEGFFRVYFQREGPARVEVTHPSFLSFRTQTPSISDLPTTLTLDTGAGLELHLSATRGPLPREIKLNLRSETVNCAREATVTGSVVTLTGLNPGAFELQLYAAGFSATEWIPVLLTEATTSSLTVTLDGSTDEITVVVLDREDHPIHGARIWLYDMRGDEACSGLTDSAGRFDVEVPRSDIRLKVLATGYERALVNNAATLIVEGQLTVQLERESAFLVNVRSADAEAVNGIRVGISTITGEPIWSIGEVLERRSLSLDETRNGSVRVSGLAAGQYKITFHRDSETLGEVVSEVGIGEEKEVAFEIPPLLEIEGVVKVNGVPASEGKLSIRSTSTSTEAVVDKEGKFITDIVEYGQFTFTLERHSLKIRKLTTKKRIVDSSRVEIDFRVVGVKGLILGPANQPLSGISGSLTGSTDYEFRTDSDGRFELYDVAVGEYSWDFYDRGLPHPCFVSRRRLRVTCDDEIIYKFFPVVELTVLPETESGELGISNASVFHLSDTGSRSWVRPGRRAGTYLWPRIEGSGYVSAPGFAPAFFDVNDCDNPEPISVVLERGGRLHVSIFHAGAGSVDHEFVVKPLNLNSLQRVLLRHRTSQAGTRTLRLPGGEYLISTTLPETGSILRGTSVVVDATTEVDLP